MINKNYTYAVIGASNNIEKYGYKVFRDLISSGYKVIPINNKEEKISGEKCYKKLSDYKSIIDVVIFVVPPQITLEILKEVKSLKIQNVWMQPRSESTDAIEFCIKNKINCIHDSCIMISRINK